MYSKVISLQSSVNTDPDSVYVEDASVFNMREVALFIITKGADIYTNGSLQGSVENMNNTGKYVLIFIDTVDYNNNLVIFNSSFPDNFSINSGAGAQLVTVPRFKNATISDKLTCKAWDTDSGTGGVAALIVDGILELQGNIDVSGKGFLGASSGNENYEGGCSSIDPGYTFGFFSASAKDSAAFKGGSIVSNNFLYPRGRTAFGNGGGGGNARFSGGGGGSNAGVGGKGGYELNSCAPGNDMGGIGGSALYPTFYSNSGEYGNRIYMGGGGGAGTQNIDQGKISTRGGNGGGIVIILANKIISSGHAIKANGQPVTEIATGGAGGGGAGGAILTDVLEYVDDLIVEVKGGKGGDCFLSADSTGPGGGGGAGVYWYNQESLPAKVTSDRNFGFSGKIGTSTYGATNGSIGNNIPNLNIPKRGFLENRIPEDQVICGETLPAVLNTPEPKGGNGPPYTYQWIKSEISENGPWVAADGINNLQSYAPPILSDTTYYARIVSDGMLTDTSFAIRIAVHPVLQNNVLADNDTICSTLSPGVLTSPSEIDGGLGGGTYTYQWEQSTDNNIWQPANGVNNQFSYNAPSLTSTTYYRRIVNSGACEDTSNALRILVLPLLINNIISTDQIICHEQQPAALTGTEPSGGLDGDRKYQWQSAIVPGNWNNEGTLSSFAPGNLTDTTFYRRIVYSGPGNTCMNISDSIKISVLPEITDNTLYHSTDTTICSGLPTISLSGSLPKGGDGIYKYIWEKRPFSGDSWEVAEEKLDLQTFKPGTLNDTIWFRRVIKSGAGDVCSNVGDSLLVKVLPLISDNIIYNPQLLCENEIPAMLTGTEPVGGDGVFNYLWEKSPDGISNWVGVNPPGATRDYSPAPLNETTYFRRVVFSGSENTCRSFSEGIKIEVQPAINNNLIITQNPYFVCYNSQPSPIQGSTNITGGDGLNYSFRWLQSNDQTFWEAGSQPNNQANYQPEELTNEIFYRRVVSSGACTDTSGIIHVNINTLPVLTQLTGSAQTQILCDDQPFHLIVDIEHGKAPYTVGYTNGVDSEIFYQNLQTDSSSYKANIYGAYPKNSFNFTIQSLVDDNGCNALNSNLSVFSVLLDVYRAPVPKVNMSDTVNICGNSLELKAIPDVGNGYWKNVNPIVSVNDTQSINPTASFSKVSYNMLIDKFFYIESTPGCGIRKDSVVANFYEEPADAFITNDLNGLTSLLVFQSDNITLNAEPPTAGIGLWSIISGPGSISTQNYSSANITDLVINEPTKVSFTIANGVCALKKDELIIERKHLKIYEGLSPNGDLLNDYLYAEGLDRSSPDIFYEFNIFNNSGAFVRKITKESPLDTQENNVLWDGKTSDGKLAGDGTYYYVMRMNYKGTEFIFKGFFVLKSE